MDIKSDLSELRLKKNQRNGVCKIWFQEGEFCFPERYWVDFSYMLLADWSRVIIEMITKNLNEGILSFVDGNFAVKLMRIGDDKFQATFGIWDPFDGVFDKTEGSKSQLNIKELALEIAALNVEIIVASEDNRIESEYLTTLTSWNDKLKKLVEDKS